MFNHKYTTQNKKFQKNSAEILFFIVKHFEQRKNICISEFSLHVCQTIIKVAR
jgi:hypothetical protein